MRISNDQVQQILQAQGVKSTGKVQKTDRAESVAKTDGASISAASQEITKALGLIAGASDVRADKVAALKAQIEAGTYQVSGADIATSLLARKTADGLL